MKREERTSSDADRRERWSAPTRRLIEMEITDGKQVQDSLPPGNSSDTFDAV